MAHRTKWKMQRALGLELPGLGKAGALDKRNYPPGQHGRDGKRAKLTQFGSQLREKQKVLFHYGLREEQLRRFVREAQRMSQSNWIGSLIELLERRVDNVVFRLGFARSIAGARQLVNHGHVLVNGRFLTIGSAVLRVGDTIALTGYAGGQMTEASRAAPRLTLPSYLRFQTGESNVSGQLASLPRLEHVPFEFNASNVAEYYAKRGV